MLKDTDITEAANVAPIEGVTGRRWRARLIEGNRLGSSGYYPAETLLRDGPKVFRKGTPIYLNHQTAEERISRPFGNVENYAGELAEDAYYDGDGLYAEIEVFEHHAPMIKALADKIGISIRARGRSVMETINGQAVPVFKELLLARSADFVVKAGAGGKLVQILESAELDSEIDSDVEEEKENMQEVLDAIKGLEAKFDGRLTALEEAATPAVEVVETAVEVDYAQALEIAETLSASSLDAEGRARVLDLHRANNKPLAELIEAEEAYVKNRKPAVEVEEGAESEEEVEESAKTFTLPSVWKRK